MFRRRRTSSRTYSRRRRIAAQQGVRTYSSRVGGGNVQPHVTRAPRLERTKMIDLDWNAQIAHTSYRQDTAMIATGADIALNATTQNAPNKRFLNLIPVGSGANDRASSRILMKSLYVRGTIYYTPLVNTNSPYDRVAIGHSTRTAAGVVRPIAPIDVDRTVTLFVYYFPRLWITLMPSWSNFLETPVTTRSLPNMDSPIGGRCLLRKSYKLSLLGSSNSTWSLGSGTRRDVSFKLNLNLPAEYENESVPGDQLSNLRRGSLAIFLLANTEPGADNPFDSTTSTCPYFQLRARLAFVDA